MTGDDHGFKPPPWARGAHVQTLVSVIQPSLPKRDEHPWVAKGDGCELHGRLWEGHGERRRDVVILYHGLGGNPEASYMRRAANVLHASGFSVLRMALRGVPVAGARATPHLYHAGLVQDLADNVREARGRGFGRVFVVGFSLSGNTLLKWLGQGGTPVDGAFAVSPPVRLSRSAALIERRENRIYHAYFRYKLLRTVRLKWQHFPDRFAPYLRPGHFASVRVFDRHVTAPFFGFDNEEDYYERASGYANLRCIEVPTEVIHATDDPFVDAEDLVLARDRAVNPRLRIRLFAAGGHMGFFAGKHFPWPQWIVNHFEGVYR